MLLAFLTAWDHSNFFAYEGGNNGRANAEVHGCKYKCIHFAGKSTSRGNCYSYTVTAESLLCLCLFFRLGKPHVMNFQDEEAGFAYISLREARPSLYVLQYLLLL